MMPGSTASCARIWVKRTIYWRIPTWHVRYFDEALGTQPLGGRSGDRSASIVRPCPELAATRMISTARAAHIERALAVAESLRIGVDDRDLRASYVASVYGYYELQVDVLARLNDVRPGSGFSAKAFEASERARARSLLESLTESGIDLRAGVDPELLRREQTGQGCVR